MLKWLTKIFRRKPAKSGGFFRAKSKFDVAGNDHDNRNHWLQADSMSPNAAVSADVRKRIRERARYEVANNSVAFGVCTTRTSDLIGTGPRPCITLPEIDTNPTTTGVTSLDREAELVAKREELEAKQEQQEALIRQVEDEFCKWAKADRLAEKLRIIKRAELIDGECFALVTSNPQQKHPVKLSLKPFECDRVCDPSGNWLADPTNSDGITFDAAGNPVSYTVLRQHPGDTYQQSYEYDMVPAADIFHWFRVDRPGQTRGVSWLTPCLDMFAILRRHTLAVLGNAELAANLAIVVQQSDSGTTPDENGEVPRPPLMLPLEEFPVPRKGGIALPPGAEVTQLRSEHATTAYGEYRREVLNELGRCLDMPLNAVQGNSSQYNFASAKIDHKPYHAQLWIERKTDSDKHLDRLFHLFLDEAVLVGLIPDGLPPIEQWTVSWDWDGFETGDALKEAQAIELLLSLGLTTKTEQCAARGVRFTDTARQRKREQDFEDRIGLRPATPPTKPAATNGGGGEVTAEDTANGY